MFCKRVYRFFSLAVMLSFSILNASGQETAAFKGKMPAWKIIEVTNEPEKREDCGFVEADGKFYLLGGRGIKPVEVFDPSTKEWVKKKSTPFEMHHFQAVAFKHKIYVVGGMTGGFPHEKPLENLWIYDPSTDQWEKGAEIPSNRRRGSGGAVVFNNRIYLVCGITDGHFEGTVDWLDEFDPLTQEWTKLENAPHPRDHFHAAIVDNNLYLAGGRRTLFKTLDLVGLTEPVVDIFDFKTQLWRSLPQEDSLPVGRAGCTAVAFKGKLVVLGGESKYQEGSHREVDALDIRTQIWKSFPPLVIGRHDTQAIIYKNKIYIVAGSAKRGGGPDQSSIESLEIR